MSGTANAISVFVRVVGFDAPRHIEPGSVMPYNDGLGVIATSTPQSGLRGKWSHQLLFLSGEEYSGNRATALRILERALQLWTETRSNELHVAGSF